MKILIADDDLKNRKLFRVLLQSSGYKTIEAENGEEAVRLAKEQTPHLILMDIQMPVMDGIAAFKALREDKDSKDIPVIALTSFAMAGDMERLLGLGFDDYISKPIDTEKFLRVIEKHLKEPDKNKAPGR